MSDVIAHIHSSFDRFVPRAEPETVAARLREIVSGLGGNILVAAEGISGAVGGTPDALLAFELALQTEPQFGRNIEVDFKL